MIQPVEDYDYIQPLNLTLTKRKTIENVKLGLSAEMKVKYINNKKHASLFNSGEEEETDLKIKFLPSQAPIYDVLESDGQENACFLQQPLYHVLEKKEANTLYTNVYDVLEEPVLTTGGKQLGDEGNVYSKIESSVEKDFENISRENLQNTSASQNNVGETAVYDVLEKDVFIENFSSPVYDTESVSYNNSKSITREESVNQALSDSFPQRYDVNLTKKALLDTNTQRGSEEAPVYHVLESSSTDPSLAKDVYEELRPRESFYQGLKDKMS